MRVADNRFQFRKSPQRCAWSGWWFTRHQALKRGATSKIHIAVDEAGRPIRIIITSGTVNDCTKADELTNGIEHEALLADKAYDTNAIIEGAEENGVNVVIPPKANRKVQREYDKDIYRYRHIVENVVEIIKRWRGIATRYAKHTKSFLAAVQIASLVGYLKSL